MSKLLSRAPRFVATALVATVAGCGWNDAVDSRTATAGLPDTRQLIQEHAWVLDRAESSLALGDSDAMTLSVVDDVVSGMGPCNRYRGDFSLGDHDDSVSISDIALTRRDCGTSTMQAEDEFIAALEAVDAVKADEDDNERLVLHNDSDVRLVFRSHDADEPRPEGAMDQEAALVTALDAADRVEITPASSPPSPTTARSHPWRLAGGQVNLPRAKEIP